MNLIFPQVVTSRFTLSIWLVLSWLILVPEDLVRGDIVTTGIYRRYFTGINNNSGYSITDLTSDSRYPYNSTDSGVYSDMQFPLPGVPTATTSSNDGQSFTGWLIPSQTGNYVFWVGGADRAELWLSPTASSTNKVKIAYITAASPSIVTTVPAPGSGLSSILPDWNAIKATRAVSTNGTFTNFVPGAAAGVITLKAGTPYYFQLLHTIASNHDGFVAVGWTQPNDGASPNGPRQIIAQYNLTPHGTYASTPNGSGATPAAYAASRFLAQATFGGTQGTGTPSSILDLADSITNTPTTAFTDWLNYQYSLPFDQATDPEYLSDLSLKRFRNFVQNQGGGPIVADVGGGVMRAFPQYPGQSYHVYFAEAGAIRAGLMIDGRHDLRRKVAWALSQFFVVGDVGNSLHQAPEGLCDYYDMLARDAFSDFKTLLKDVTYHPIMGEYLSSVNNAKADPVTGSHPDENYAREIMQLFSIGLYKLDASGNILVDGAGVPIPTYTIDEVTELARVFTGLVYRQDWVETKTSTAFHLTLINKDIPAGGYYPKFDNNAKYGPMAINEANHDTGSKTFVSFGNTTIPSGANSTAADIDAALNMLISHQSTAPFFCKAMIQRLVTSNPSPNYIHRVVNAFNTAVPNSSGGGTHIGDMRTIITAILTDTEARKYDDTTLSMSSQYGKYQEPWIRLMEISRAFQAPALTTTNLHYPLFESILNPMFGEFPLGSSSVFNFYLPTYQPPPTKDPSGTELVNFKTLNLVGPELQILNANTGVTIPNYFMKEMMVNGTTGNNGARQQVMLDFTNQLALAGTATVLLDNLDMLLTHGRMKKTGATSTYSIIQAALNNVAPDSPTMSDALRLQRVRTAVYLISISPDFADQK